MMRVTHVMAVAKIAVARHRGVAAAAMIAMVKVARLRDRYRQAQCRHQRCGNQFFAQHGSLLVQTVRHDAVTSRVPAYA